MALTEMRVRKAKLPEDKKVVRICDGGGLYLRIRPSGKDWVFRYTFAGKRREIGLGTYPAVSLKQARAMAQEFRAMLVRGEDPARTKGKRRQKDFAAAAGAWFRDLESAGTAQGKIDDYRRWLEKDILPAIGSKALDEITPADVLLLMRRIHAAGHDHKARRVHALIGRVFRYAIQHGWTQHNPAAGIEPRDALPPERAQHRPAITEPARLAELMRAIRGYDRSIIVRAGLLLLAYTFVRPGEARLARWDEIDLKGGLWRIPAERTKMRRDHIVPLARQVRALLGELHEITGDCDFVLPGFRPGRPLSDNTFNAALRSLGFDTRTEHCAHGFRSTAATLLAEMGWPPDVIERQLAHAEPNRVKAAYQRAEYLPERRKMMQDWADYLDSLSD